MKRCCLSFWILFTAWSVDTDAAPVPAFSLPVLTSAADVIAIGAIGAVDDRGPSAVPTPSGTLPGRAMVAELRVDRLLKGQLATNRLTVRFAIPDKPNGYRTLSPNSYRLVFLRQTADGFEFASPFHPSTVAVPGGVFDGETPEDRVIAATAQVLSAPASSSAKTEAIFALWGLKRASAIDGLRAALQEVDQAVRLSAAAALLAAGDMTSWGIAEAALREPTKAEDAQLVHNLRVGIAQGVRAPAAIPRLAQLLGIGDVGTRRAIASALAEIDSAAAVSPLSRALDDLDFEVRLSAVRGLARISGQRALSPSWDAFQANEARFVSPLKAWVLKNFGVQ